MPHTDNVNPEEIHKFDASASDWWDLNGSMRLLHQLNPLRLSFIQMHVAVEGKAVLDVGCGGGILTESLAKLGGVSAGIDMSEAALATAKAHASAEGLMIDYQQTPIEALLSRESKKTYDVITCMEMLEHVPDPVSIIGACSRLLNENGIVFFSTLNRNPKAFFQAIVGAEYLLGLVPKGTHHYKQFIKPSELITAAEAQGLTLVDMKGLSYHPISKSFSLSSDPSVNYLVALKKAL